MTTFPTTFTYEQIDARLAELRSDPTYPYATLIEWTSTVEDLTGETLKSYPLFRAKLTSLGVSIYDADGEPHYIVIRDAESLDRCNRLTDEICDEYEGVSDDTNHWEELSLGGDDSVDYCSSYLDPLWAVLRDMTA